jgi:hypothetical protein
LCSHNAILSSRRQGETRQRRRGRSSSGRSHTRSHTWLGCSSPASIPPLRPSSPCILSQPGLIPHPLPARKSTADRLCLFPSAMLSSVLFFACSGRCSSASLPPLRALLLPHPLQPRCCRSHPQMYKRTEERRGCRRRRAWGRRAGRGWLLGSGEERRRRNLGFHLPHEVVLINRRRSRSPTTSREKRGRKTRDIKLAKFPCLHTRSHLIRAQASWSFKLFAHVNQLAHTSNGPSQLRRPTSVR